MEADFFTFVCLIIPALISVIVKPGWSNAKKLVTALGVSGLAAFIQVLYLQVSSTGTCSFSDLPGIAVKAITLVMTSYAIFWRPTGLAQQIEKKVNP